MKFEWNPDKAALNLKKHGYNDEQILSKKGRMQFAPTIMLLRQW
jgi:uncharacterized DUF497 family protein